MHRLKTAYGDYVTIIYLCSSEKAVEADYASMESFSEEERRARLENDQKIRQVYLDNYEIFDYLVIYTGENTVFDTNAVYRMYEHIISVRRVQEQALNDQHYVELPYMGKEPFIFVSYSRADKTKVYLVMKFLQTAGYRIWYDDGIPGGENWRKIIALKIQECTDFLLFASESSKASRHVAAELNAVEICNESLDVDQTIRIITVRMDQSKMPLERQMYLSRQNRLMLDDSSFYLKLKKALNNDTCSRKDSF